MRKEPAVQGVQIFDRVEQLYQDGPLGGESGINEIFIGVNKVFKEK